METKGNKAVASDFVIGDTTGMSIAQLAEATNKVFEGYYSPVNHTALGYGSFCRMYSLDVANSVAVHDQNGRLAGLTMLGIRGNRGWVGGFGITPEFRGQGVAHLLVNGLIDRARSLNLQTLLLEVLVQNEPAFRTYQRAGFQTGRNMIIMAAPVTQVLPALQPGHSVQMEISEVEPEEAIRLATRMEPAYGFEPCWQREPATLYMTAGLRGIVAQRGGSPLAVLLYSHNPQTGAISIGNLTFYNEAAAKALLERASVNSKILRTREGAQEETFRILNEPENSELFSLLSEIGLQEVARQYEMMLTLS
ncbi:MAG TPA: GNAT family N-acetyltransferase [Chloroflexia bacterium]|nr:GNAT family N-acetyltransferase [Chloroflexia bacterium]